MAILRESHVPFPNLLSAFRIACVPLLLALAWHGAVEFFLGGFAIALVCMLLPTAIAVAKYRAMPGYHTWSVKLGAVAMGIGVTLLLLVDVEWPFRVAALFQMLCAIDELGITLLLAECRHDVPSVFHAMRIRRG